MNQTDASYLIDRFLHPAPDCRPALMWFWNERLEKNEIAAQMKEFCAAGIRDFFVHPLSAAEYEYLSEEFFDAIRFTVKTAKELGLHFWIYDEYNWPSGIAGGKVLRDHPEFQGKVLRSMQFTVKEGRSVNNVYADGSFLRADYRAAKGDPSLRRPITDAEIRPCDGGFHFRWINRFCTPVTVTVYSVAPQNYLLPASRQSRCALFQHGYIDALNADAIRAFIDYTHEKYKEAIGEEFGKTVRGVFTDEICAAFSLDLNFGSVPWTDGLAEAYRERYGQDLLPWLHALTDLPRTNEEKQVRYRFWQWVTDAMNRCHLRQVADWCRAEGLEYTGHFYGEESLIWWQYQSGDIFRQLKEMTIPGMDSIYSIPRIDDENFNLAPKLLASCGRLYGKKRLLCETFSGSGYQLRFDQMRRVVNRLMTLGINRLQWMGAYFSLDSGRKLPLQRAHFNGSNPLFRHLKQFGDYVARVQAISAETEPCGNVLLVCPMAGVSAAVNGRTRLFETYYYRHENFPEGYLDRTVIGVAQALLRRNVEFDLCSDAMARDVTCADGKASLYGCEYTTVILPETKNTTSEVIAMARRLRDAGVRTVWINDLPETAVDTGEAVTVTADERIVQDFSSLSAADPRWDALLAPVTDGARTWNVSHPGGVYTGLRRRGNTSVLFVSNDTENTVPVTLTCPEASLSLDPETGTFTPFARKDERVSLELGPHQMRILLTGKDVPDRKVSAPAPAEPFLRLTDPEILFPEGNVCSAHWKAIGTDGTVIASDPERRPFPGDVCLAGGRQELLFDFEIRGPVPSDLTLWIETNDLLRYDCNGIRIDRDLIPARLWGTRDKKLPLAPFLREGLNRLTATVEIRNDAGPFLAPYAFLRGSFATDGNTLFPQAQARRDAGYPDLFGAVRYRWVRTLTAEEAAAITELTVESHDALRLSVNATDAGCVLWEPFRFDLTGLLKEGENVFELTATLPLHNAFCLPDERIPVGLRSDPVLLRR